MHARFLQLTLVATIALGGAIGACATTNDKSDESLNEDSGGTSSEDSSTTTTEGGGEEDTSFNLDSMPVDPEAAALAIEPADPIVDVTIGGTIPTVSFVAKASGTPVAVAWGIDRGEIGALNVSTGVFTPTGTLGGKATVTATYGGKKATTS